MSNKELTNREWEAFFPLWDEHTAFAVLETLSWIEWE